MGEADTSFSAEVTAAELAGGRLEGFRFVSAQGAGAVPQQEYDVQAEHFAAAPDSEMALSADGSVRWRGQLIAKLKAADDILRPQSVLLADAALSGEALEKAQARLALFVARHFEAALKPLYDLAAAEALFEKPRFIALRLVEHLGIVPRRDIAAHIKELDQESRAALRRLGVRFGVYHIFVPQLLKPAAAQALTLLWALKHDARDKAGYSEVISYLSAGRTSFAADKDFDRQFYRLAGYRILGRKAVRIDMLERCADLIRRAVSWSPEAGQAAGGADARPEGAYDGRHFTISQAMLSILGITPEDMEEVLKQLGYVAHSISAAEHKAFLAHNGGAESVPQAEPVGDWSAAAAPFAAAEPVGGLAAAARGEPEAEPVGPKFSGAGDTSAVLLWRYQKRSHQPQKRRQSKPFAAQQRQGKPVDRAEKSAAFARGGARAAGRNSGQARAKEAKQSGEQQEARGQNYRQGRPNADFGKNGRARGFDGKGDGKKQSRSIKPEDSPFAALLALRDKMKK